MKKRHSAEQIVVKLRQADVGLGKGLRVPEVCKELGISEQTCYGWRQKYGSIPLGATMCFVIGIPVAFSVWLLNILSFVFRSVLMAWAWIPR